jgi:regulator of PEP synthase PpsR (kinase-PPPase family)
LKHTQIILVGVSRVGKTPLSMYLSILGWKVANVPLIPDIPMPPKLLAVDARRVVGLTIDPTELMYHRKHRQEALGVSHKSAYIDPKKIYEEVDTVEKLIRRHGFRKVDVTNKPLETSADEIIHLLKHQLNISEK